MRRNVIGSLKEWLANPCGATHSRLVRDMQAFNDTLDEMVLRRKPFYYEPDGEVYEDNFYVHPELVDALLMAAEDAQETANE